MADQPQQGIPNKVLVSKAFVGKNMDQFTGMQCNEDYMILFYCYLTQAGIDSEVEHNNAKHILLEMGEFFQIQVPTHISLITTNLTKCICSVLTCACLDSCC